MGRGHQINIFRTLGDECLKSLPKLIGIHRGTYGAAADGGILAIAAFQSTASEKDGTAATIACQSRLFPFVEHGFCYQGSIGTAAETKLACCAVCTALSGTERAVYIIHKNTSFGNMIAVFRGFHKPCFTFS